MTDVSQAANDDWPNDDWDNPSEFVARDIRQAQLSTMASVDDDPEKAARAQQLSDATGTPAPVIYANQDNFETQHKAKLTSDLLRNNDYLAQFANSDPMVPKIANDDWGNLDAISQSLLKVTPFANIYGDNPVFKAFRDKFNQAFSGPPGSMYMDTPKDLDEAQAHPGYGALAAGVALAGLVPETGLRVISGLIGGVAAAGEEGYKQVTGKDATETGEGITQALSDPGLAASLGPLGVMFEGLVAKVGQNAEIRAAMDKARVDTNQAGIKAVDEAVKEAQSSTTKERAPELFQNFVQQHVQDARMGISGNKVLEMYGDKVPTPDDGVLGWVPDLAAQMEAAKDTGADISVPLSDYISKIDPAIHKELQDDLRVVPGGITNYEAEEAAKFNEAKDTAQTSTGVTPPPETIVPEAVPTYRNDVGLEPLFSIGDRKLQLNRLENKSENFGPTQGFHDFDMVNENGETVGTLNLSEQKGGKELYVDNINGLGEYFNPQNFGPALMRDLLRQVKTMFPNAETLTGHRVSGAREVANTLNEPHAIPKIRLDETLAKEGTHEKFSQLMGGAWSPLNRELNAYIKPSELWQEHENEIYDAVDAELKTIAPDLYHGAVSEIKNTTRNKDTRGVYFRRDPAHKLGPYVIWAMNGDDPIGTIRHEAIHHLRNDGFFKPDEWAALEKASKDEGWEKYFGIDRHYFHTSKDIQTEESIAEGYRMWASQYEDRQRQPNFQATAVDKIFQKLKDFLDAIAGHVRRITGTQNANDLFSQVHSGEIGSRTPTQTRTVGGTLMDEGDRPISDPGQGIDGTSPFKAARDVGMTLDQHKNYMKSIEAQQQSDLKASTNRVLKEQTKRQSAEWKAQSEAMRPQVVSDLNARPDISADKFFGLGELHGTKLDKTYKLDWESLTPEQRKALPEKYTVREGGVKPDEVANLFGYQTGDQMIDGLAKITAARGDMRRDRFDRQLVSNEISRRMEQEHGYLEKNILEDTRDQVLSENQLQLMHQETMKLAMDSGQAPPLDLATITAGIKAKFDELPMGAAKSAQYEREMGKQNKLAELSLLSNNPAEAFRAKQVAQHNMIYLQMARAVEKQRARLDKAARAYRRVDPPKNVEPEYVNHIQNLLQQAGYKIRRSAENIQENIERTAQNLTEFANSKLADTNGMRDIPVADIITDNKVGPVDSMTTKDFLGFKQTIDALIENGKDERRIIKDGEAFELKAINDQMIDNIKTFDLQPLKASAGKFDKALNFPGTMLAAVTNIETFLNRLGRRDPNSVWNKFIIRPVFSAAGEKFQIQKELAGEIKDLGEFGDPNKAVAPPFLAPDGRPFTNFTRRNVWGMLQHAGNASNWTAFAKGWGQDPQVLMTWLEANTRPEDWQFMQGFGKRVFGNIVKKADGVYERLNGTTIDKIPLTQFANKHGTFDGWYSPLIPDLNYSGKSPLKFGNYDDADYGHISTANGYTMKRTGATYPISMDPSRTMTRINQMIHDVAYREVILNSQKLFKASRLNDAITAHYGADYNTENFLKPWLKDLAGQESTPSAAMGVASQVAEGLRQNIIGTYIGFNPGTVMKHGPTAWGYSMRQIGPANFLRAFRDLYLRSDDINAENNEHILKLSNELPMRERFWQDTIGGQYSRLEQSHGLAGFRQEIQRYGALAVAKSDMISAKPTFFGAYRDARENMDMTSGDARDYADQQVRLAHGSIAAPNLPSAVRTTGAMGKFYTSLYGFFGTTMQRRIEMAHDINDAYKFYKAGDFNGAMKMSGSAFTNFMTYWVLPTAIEEAVTGTTTDDHRSWGRHLVSATFLGLSSTALFVRDIVQGIESGHETGTGLLDSALGEFSHGVEAPFKHDAWSRARAGKTVADTMTAFGLTTGMLPKTIANSSRFGIDLVNGQAHPKTIGDWYRGLARGQTKARVVK